MSSLVLELGIVEVRKLLELLQGAPAAVRSLELEGVVKQMQNFAVKSREHRVNECIVLSEN